MDKVIPAESDLTIPAGYTYFGQFIDHDLTRDDTPLNEAGAKPPCETENHRVPWLDLDNLYGDGPFCSKHGHLYATDGVSFRLGESLINGEQFDVPLDEKTKMPQLVDDRNNENVIVRQVHAMFLKLHNAAVKELPSKLPARERFERARDRVRWQYQWLIRHHFLKRVCEPKVYDDVITGGHRLINWESAFSIPVEFSQAAFRFGHSMVRDSYVLNTEPTGTPGNPAGVSLAEIFAGAHAPGPLPPKLRVDWNRFLGGPTGGKGHEFAFLIDTSIAKPLFHLPPEGIRLFVKSLTRDEPEELPVRTLRRGAATGLPTGEQVEMKLGRALLRSSTEGAEWKVLDDLDLKGKTPLWYYILLEAELERGGVSLGTIGSRLVAELIEECLRQDPGSFLRDGPDWFPPPWIGPQGRPIAVRTLLDLACVVGLATPGN
jgi:heme peroxidase